MKVNKSLEKAIQKQIQEITLLDLSEQECMRNGHFEKAKQKRKRKHLLLKQIAIVRSMK